MPLPALDPALLSLQDALDLAILIEDEAMERYQEFAHQMETHRTPEAAQFFRYMVENEAKHGRELQARRTERFGAAPVKVGRDQLWDVEAPVYDAVRAFMTPRMAMETALAAEVKAYEFFDRALGAITDPEVKALFLELRNEEREHQERVKAELGKLGPDSGLSDEDFVDPPAPQ
jgi:rubrerythrin